jgi:hypothetical protein
MYLTPIPNNLRNISKAKHIVKIKLARSKAEDSERGIGYLSKANVTVLAKITKVVKITKIGCSIIDKAMY